MRSRLRVNVCLFVRSTDRERERDESGIDRLQTLLSMSHVHGMARNACHALTPALALHPSCLRAECYPFCMVAGSMAEPRKPLESKPCTLPDGVLDPSGVSNVGKTLESKPYTLPDGVLDPSGVPIVEPTHF